MIVSEFIACFQMPVVEIDAGNIISYRNEDISAFEFIGESEPITFDDNGMDVTNGKTGRGT